MIKLKNIVKKYGDNIAVEDISLEIGGGEIVGLLGPNGAGKSTTMKITTGYLIPDDGIVEIDGQSVKDNLVAIKKGIGYMPENNPLYKDMIVKDAINYAMKLHNVPQEIRKERLDYVVKATGIEKVYYRPISELSKGYKQRVGLAQVLVHEPKILILDEPTEGLDPNQRAEIRNLIKQLGKDRTVIISTHVMQEVEAMCSRIILINKGKVVADGSKDEVLKSKGKDANIKLKVKARDNKLSKASFEGISLANIQINSAGNNVFEINFSTTDQNIFENINDLVRKNNWVIYELIQKRQNLEELFRELTRE